MSFDKNKEGKLIYISPPTNYTWTPNDPNKVEYDPLIKKYSGIGGSSYGDRVINTKTTDEEKYAALKKINKEQDVCGVGNYVKKAEWRQANLTEDPCHPCPPGNPLLPDKGSLWKKGDDLEKQGQIMYAGISDDFKNQGFPDIPAYDQLKQMCDSNITTWFPAQHEEKPYRGDDVAGKINWDHINTVLVSKTGNLNSNEHDILKSWYVDRMEDDDLLNRMDKLEWKEDITDKSKRLQEFRNTISATRGSTVQCIEPKKLNTSNKKLYTSLETAMTSEEKKEFGDFKCPDSQTFGPDYIVSQEYEEWSTDYLRNPKNQYASGKADFKLWGEDLMAPNPRFEKCINRLLNENTNDHDQQIISGIHGKKSIYELKHNEILFIKRKLQLLFVDDTHDDILTCIRENIIIDTTICEMGLTEQMNLILNILFSVIGFQFNLDELDVHGGGSKKIIYIIDQLGDIIPRALQRIVDISKKLEVEQCNGKVSKNTMVLEELYSKIFTSGKNVFAFDMGISKMVSEASNQEFDRSTILMVLGIAFLKYF